MKFKKNLFSEITFSLIVIAILWGCMPLESHMEMKMVCSITIMIFAVLNFILKLRS